LGRGGRRLRLRGNPREIAWHRPEFALPWSGIGHGDRTVQEHAHQRPRRHGGAHLGRLASYM
jgi:hypothetical protein